MILAEVMDNLQEFEEELNTRQTSFFGGINFHRSFSSHFPFYYLPDFSPNLSY